jgi:putative hydrolase of HD superfamily
MYRMGMMSLLASDCGVDTAHCMKLALVHDVAEALVGDITPHCNVSDGDKHAMEAAAVQEIKAMLGGHTQAGGCVGVGMECGQGVSCVLCMWQPAGQT